MRECIYEHTDWLSHTGLKYSDIQGCLALSLKWQVQLKMIAILKDDLYLSNKFVNYYVSYFTILFLYLILYIYYV